ncbi:MAG: YaiO family outer membrane beta-barrel protein [Candidatus Marinimicrobia bacterium]|nr:YaiO family outer membrane beta-barrel protein [Candidatus Neomarinimicrobiota bacterium]
MKKILITVLIIFSFLSAQNSDYETLHEKGRELYQKGDPSEALEVYQEILNLYPDDVDALLFRGRLFARLEMYDLAEAELIHTLELAPDYLDAYYALASVYYWSGQLDKAKVVLTDWLMRDLENPDAYLLSARVAIAGMNYPAARTFLEQAGEYGADMEIIGELLSRLNTPVKSTKWESGIGYEYLAVDGGRPDWQHLRAFITHDFDKILITAELSRYNRNNTADHAIVLDSYYGLWDKAYMNTRLQAGLNWEFLPRFDITAEVFQAVGTRHEAAAGYRMMHYGDTTAHIPSFAWALYPGKWYLREKLSMIVNNGISWQNQLTARYFLDDADTYIQLMNVWGTDFQNNTWVNSLSFALSGSYALNEHWILSLVASWTRDEYNLNRIGGSAGVAYRW